MHGGDVSGNGIFYTLQTQKSDARQAKKASALALKRAAMFPKNVNFGMQAARLLLERERREAMRGKQLLRGPAVMRGISLPQELDRALVERAYQEDRPISRVIRRALICYFSQDNEDQQQQTREVGDAS